MPVMVAGADGTMIVGHWVHATLKDSDLLVAGTDGTMIVGH